MTTELRVRFPWQRPSPPRSLSDIFVQNDICICCEDDRDWLRVSKRCAVLMRVSQQMTVTLGLTVTSEGSNLSSDSHKLIRGGAARVFIPKLLDFLTRFVLTIWSEFLYARCYHGLHVEIVGSPSGEYKGCCLLGLEPCSLVEFFFPALTATGVLSVEE